MTKVSQHFHEGLRIHIANSFHVGHRYTPSEIKSQICDLYGNPLNIFVDTTNDAIRILQHCYEIKRCKIRINNKRLNGYEILGPVEIKSIRE